MTNQKQTKCNIKEPHSHLVHGQTFECEKGQPTELKKCEKCMGIGIFECEHNTPQKQPQLRERAREMIEEAIGKDKVVPIQPVQYVGRQLGYNEAKTEIRSKLPELINQIITLAQEEKEDEICKDLEQFFKGKAVVIKQ